MKTVFKALGAAGLAAGLAACSAFGPERDPPRMPSPEHYAALPNLRRFRVRTAWRNI